MKETIAVVAEGQSHRRFQLSQLHFLGQVPAIFRGSFLLPAMPVEIVESLEAFVGAPLEELRGCAGQIGDGQGSFGKG